MTLIALSLSLCVAVIGAVGLFAPARMLQIINWFESRTGLYLAAGFRIALGFTLLFSAHTSHFPEVIRILGIVILIAGVLTPFIGIKRVHKLIRWWSLQDLYVVRVWGGITLGLGLFLISAVVT